jgi:glycosyltransferase 2 family protein
MGAACPRIPGREAAGLTGVGISSGAAVSAVLTFRLATYWLPVLPGWLCLHLLQPMDYV